MEIQIGTKEQLQEYKQSDCINQSYLKIFSSSEKVFKFLKNIENTNKSEEDGLYFEDKTHISIGSAVDTLVTRGQEAFEEEFYISNLELPSDKIVSICHRIFDKIQSNSLEVIPDLSLFTNELQEAIIEEGYYTNRKMQTNIDNVYKEGSEYFNLLVNAKGKTIISPTNYEIVQQAQQTLTNKISEVATYFSFSKILFQVPFYHNNYKILPDIIGINHKDKIITIIDIKTTSFFRNMFISKIKDFRIDIQLAFYRKVLQHHFPDYTIYCNLLVVNINIPTECYKLEFEEDVLNVALNGFTDIYTFKTFNEDNFEYSVDFNVKRILGIEQLLERCNYVTELIISSGESANKIVNSFEQQFLSNTINNTTLYFKV